jgi:dihydroorotase-like cyclic amidohydrolase
MFLIYTEARPKIPWNAKALEAGAKESEIQLMRHIFDVISTKHSTNQMDTKIMPWANADDFMANSELGVPYTFCTEPTRYEWTNVIENISMTTMRPFQLKQAAEHRHEQMIRAVND